MTTTSKTTETRATTGSIAADIKARLAAVGDRIRKQYKVSATPDVLLIDAAEQELAQCESCNGQCKTSPAFFQPQIEVFGGQAYVSVITCKFGEKFFRQAELERKCREAGIPPIYIGKTFADYEVNDVNRAAVEFAQACLTEKLRGAFFYGKPGVGKTFLASLVAQAFLKAGKSVKFSNVPNLLSGFYEIYRGQSNRNETDLLNELYTVDLLVLDDFGLEKVTQYVGATMCKIIDARYNRENSTTLITSNHSMKEIAAKFNKPMDGEEGLNGSRICDRCVEFCKTISFKGNSRRE